MRVADTSVLYAAFVAEDAHHAKGKAALADDEPIVVPSEIFAETVALIQWRFTFEQARLVGAFVRGLPHVRIESSSNSVGKAAWDEYETAGGAISLPDAFVVAWVRAEGAKPLAFDKRLLRRCAK
jgi:predicted nucleic acid-binding protein